MANAKPVGRKRGLGGGPKRRRRKGAMTAMWGAFSAVFTVVFLLVQGTALLVVMILSIVVTVLSAVAEMVPDPNGDSLGSDRPRPAAKTAQPRQLKGKRPSASIIRCTVTGKPIDGCSCAAKHIRTEDGARRYKSRIGAPLVKSASKRATSGNVAAFSPDRRRNLDLGRRGDRPAG